MTSASNRQLATPSLPPGAVVPLASGAAFPWFVWLAWVALCVPLAISLWLTPADIESGRWLPALPCLFKSATGIECWTCGMTRAFTALGHGDWQRALEYNRGAPFAYAALCLGASTLLVVCLRATKRYLRAKPRR